MEFQVPVQKPNEGKGFFLYLYFQDSKMIPQKKVFHEKSNFLGTSRTIKLLGRMAKLYRF